MKTYNEHHIGETHMSREGYEIVVVKGSNRPKYVTVNIDRKYSKIVQYSSIVKGHIKNLYHKSVYGHGYIGVGGHKASIKGVLTKKYRTWKGMLNRCYSSDYHIKHPIYEDATVCKEWHNFQVFGEWYDNQRMEDGWQLDKDLLSGGKKVYSPDTCVFIPRELNIFLIRDNGNRDCPTGVDRVGSRYRSQIQCSLSGRRLHLGTYNTIEEADLAYRNKRLINMIAWLRYLDNHLYIERRAYERMKVIYKEYKKERDILERREYERRKAIREEYKKERDILRRRAYKEMKVIYEEYKKKRDILRKRIEHELMD